jgi:hypothetical protein
VAATEWVLVRSGRLLARDCCSIPALWSYFWWRAGLSLIWGSMVFLLQVSPCLLHFVAVAKPQCFPLYLNILYLNLARLVSVQQIPNRRVLAEVLLMPPLISQ